MCLFVNKGGRNKPTYARLKARHLHLNLQHVEGAERATRRPKRRNRRSSVRAWRGACAPASPTTSACHTRAGGAGGSALCKRRLWHGGGRALPVEANGRRRTPWLTCGGFALLSVVPLRPTPPHSPPYVAMRCVCLFVINIGGCNKTTTTDPLAPSFIIRSQRPVQAVRLPSTHGRGQDPRGLLPQQWEEVER